jgi:hypothetical protein
MSRAKPAVGAFVALGIVAAAACGTGATDQSPPVTVTSGIDAAVPDAAPDHPFFVGDVICGNFESASPASCCDQGNACASDDDCSALVACLRRCTFIDAGSGCVEGCKADHAPGLQVLLALDACTRSSCASDCPATSGGGIAGVVLEPAIGHCAQPNSCAWPDCKDCDGVADNGCEASLFESPYDCGACGHACAGGQICSHGICAIEGTAPVSTIAPGLGVAEELAVGGGYAYFDGFDQTTSHPTIRRVPIAGGAVEVLATLANANGTVSLAADDTYAYAVSSEAVRRIAHATGQVEVVYSSPNPLDVVLWRVAAFAGTAYTLETTASTPATSILSFSAGATTPVDVADSAPPTQLDGPIAADARGVFVFSQAAGLYFVAAAGPFPATPALVAPGIAVGQVLRSDGTDLFTVASGDLTRIDGVTGAKTVLAKTDPAANALAVDASSVFYQAATPVWSSTWDVTRLPKDGSTATVLVKATSTAALYAYGGTLYFLGPDPSGAALDSVPAP